MSSSREKRPKLSRFKMHRSKARAAEKIGWWNSHLSVIAHSPRRKNNDLCRRRQRRFAESHAEGGEIFVGIILDEHVEEVRAFSVVHRDRDLWFELLQHFACGVRRHRERTANRYHSDVHLAEGFDLFVGQLVAQIA